jgi:hypothetical protein
LPAACAAAQDAREPRAGAPLRSGRLQTPGKTTLEGKALRETPFLMKRKKWRYMKKKATTDVGLQRTLELINHP